jgi:hypothetical protein
LTVRQENLVTSGQFYNKTEDKEYENHNPEFTGDHQNNIID